MASNVTISPDPVSATGRVKSYVNPVAPNTVLDALSLDLRAVSKELEDLGLDLRVSETTLIDFGVDFRAVTSTVLQDISLDLRATDGVTLEDLGLVLRVAATTPTFRSYVGQRLSSIKTDTGISI